MSDKAKNVVTGILSVVIAVILLQTLFFKFTGAPETQHIFRVFSEWADGFGMAFLFSRFGPLGPIASGLLELAASLLLLVGTFISSKRAWQAVGGVLAAVLMSGASMLHLITPLGVDVQGDGGLLFGMAVTALLSGAVIAWLRCEHLPLVGKK